MFPVGTLVVAVLAAVIVGGVAGENATDPRYPRRFHATRAGIAGALALCFCLGAYAAGS